MMRNPLVLAVGVALLCVAAVVGYQYLFPAKGSLSYNAACAQSGCGWTGTASVEPKPGEPYPPVCPKCGKNSVLPLATCKKCGHKQHLNEEVRAQRDAEGKFVIAGADKLPESTKCSQCGGPIRHGD